jgi:hypothetical protein
MCVCDETVLISSNQDIQRAAVGTRVWPDVRVTTVANDRWSTILCAKQTMSIPRYQCLNLGRNAPNQADYLMS